MKIIKRNGSEAAFDISKIIVAIGKANATVDESIRMTPVQIQRIAESVVLSCERLGRSPSVEEVQDMVEKQIMAHGAFEVAKNYITYRYTRTLVRQSNTTDDKILSLIECKKTPTRTPLSIPPSATIWRARFRAILPTAYCCQRK